MDKFKVFYRRYLRLSMRYEHHYQSFQTEYDAKFFADRLQASNKEYLQRDDYSCEPVPYSEIFIVKEIEYREQ